MSTTDRRLKYQVIVIGGGLAGLVNSIVLAKAGIRVLLIEKQSYPFHKVCGEYISNEVLPFLRSIGADPAVLQPVAIHTLQLSAPSGRSVGQELDTGGFGISRHAFDHFLFTVATAAGVEFMLDTTVTEAAWNNDRFRVTTMDRQAFEASVVIGSFGKHSNIDRLLQRPFFLKKSPYIGVKYHMKTSFPDGLVALHNFENGYCGVSNVENGVTNVCYLTVQENLKRSGGIEQMEQQLLRKNPFLDEIFGSGTKLFDEPKTISQVSFEPKNAVENHMLMCGDAAGLITPLCGNGMAMAIHSAGICSALVKDYFEGKTDRETLENAYAKSWNGKFRQRLNAGRTLQELFGKPFVSELSLAMLKVMPFLLPPLVKATHGKPFAANE